MNVQSYAAFQANEALRPFSYHLQELAPHEVDIEVSYCGVCQSDIHMIHNDSGISTYPLVPGHEVIGSIQRLGEKVSSFKVGQRVGVGWQVQSCMECEWCIRGNEHLCSRQLRTCVGHFGGFANMMRADSRFVFAIPDSLDSAKAAPMLCAGITVYSPLRHLQIAPPMKVGIIGIGGLGHLAIQFAHSFGCEVTAFSTSPEKENEARGWGASHFIVSNQEEKMKSRFSSLDFILSTTDASIDVETYLKILRPHGKLCLVGLTYEKMSLSPLSLLRGEKSIWGSVIGNRSTIQEMLNFAARHHIEPKIETMPLSQVNEALEKVGKGKARYRVVLKV